MPRDPSYLDDARIGPKTDALKNVRLGPLVAGIRRSPSVERRPEPVAEAAVRTWWHAVNMRERLFDDASHLVHGLDYEGDEYWPSLVRAKTLYLEFRHHCLDRTYSEPPGYLSFMRALRSAVPSHARKVMIVTRVDGVRMKITYVELPRCKT